MRQLLHDDGEAADLLASIISGAFIVFREE